MTAIGIKIKNAINLCVKDMEYQFANVTAGSLSNIHLGQMTGLVGDLLMDLLSLRLVFRYLTEFILY